MGKNHGRLDVAFSDPAVMLLFWSLDLTERVLVGPVFIVGPFLDPIPNLIKLFSRRILMNHLLANLLNYIT